MKLILKLEALTFEVISTTIALLILAGILLGSYILGIGLYTFFTSTDWIRTPAPCLFGG